MKKNQKGAVKFKNIHIASSKEGGLLIDATLNGEKIGPVKLSKEDVNNFSDKTDRQELAKKYLGRKEDGSKIDNDYQKKMRELESLGSGWKSSFLGSSKKYGEGNIRVMNIGVKYDHKNSKNYFQVNVGEQKSPIFGSEYEKQIKEATQKLSDTKFNTAKEASKVADAFVEKFNSKEIK